MLTSQEIAAHVDEIRQQIDADTREYPSGIVSYPSGDATRRIVYDVYQAGGKSVARWRYFDGSEEKDEHHKVFNFRMDALEYLNGDAFNKPIREHLM